MRALVIAILLLGAGPGCDDLDPIDSDNIVPAKRAAGHLNNVEMVQVSQPKPGRWQVVVTAHKVPEPLQTYSLGGDQPARGADWQSLYLPRVGRGEYQGLMRFSMLVR